MNREINETIKNIDIETDSINTFDSVLLKLICHQTCN